MLTRWHESIGAGTIARMSSDVSVVDVWPMGNGCGVVLGVSPTMHAMCCPTTDGKAIDALAYRISSTSLAIARRCPAWAGGGDVTSESEWCTEAGTGTLGCVDALR